MQKHPQPPHSKDLQNYYPKLVLAIRAAHLLLLNLSKPLLGRLRYVHKSILNPKTVWPPFPTVAASCSQSRCSKTAGDQTSRELRWFCLKSHWLSQWSLDSDFASRLHFLTLWLETIREFLLLQEGPWFFGHLPHLKISGSFGAWEKSSSLQPASSAFFFDLENIGCPRKQQTHWWLCEHQGSENSRKAARTSEAKRGTKNHWGLIFFWKIYTFPSRCKSSGSFFGSNLWGKSSCQGLCGWNWPK